MTDQISADVLPLTYVFPELNTRSADVALLPKLLSVVKGTRFVDELCRRTVEQLGVDRMSVGHHTDTLSEHLLHVREITL